MTIDYSISKLTEARRSVIECRRNGTILSSSTYYSDTLSVVVGPFLGSLCGFAAYACYGSFWFFLLGFLLFYEGFRRARKWMPYGRWLRSWTDPARFKDPPKHIRLELTGEGMREHQGDIVSFVPWKDVERTFIEDDLLVIQLSSNQEAHIPRECPGFPSPNLEEIQREVERRRDSAKSTAQTP